MGCLQSKSHEQDIPSNLQSNLCIHNENIDIYQNYTIQHSLGVGAFGTVMKIIQKQSNHTYALKTMDVTSSDHTIIKYVFSYIWLYINKTQNLFI